MNEYVPGPGTYTVVPPKSPVAYTMSGRTFTKEESLSPGPGAYNADHSIGKSGPAYSLSGKTEDKLINDSPGPAAYSAGSTIGRHTPAFSMSGRYNEQFCK
jgi:hypothetical protein